MVHERLCRECQRPLVQAGDLCAACVVEARRMRAAAERAARQRQADERADAAIAAKFDPKATPVLPFGRKGRKRARSEP